MKMEDKQYNVLFLDASKAFDRICYSELFTVEDWYNHQISNLLQKKQRKQNNEQM